jgi:CelD/BcsL family acetyltransferase involved in cellulose biosynthesis
MAMRVRRQVELGTADAAAQGMNFYASPEYLAVVAEAYFRGSPARVEDVRIGRDVLRLLVVDESRVITEVPFLDYHEPLVDSEIRWPTRAHGHARWVTRGVIEAGEWNARLRPAVEAAPYVDWSKVAGFDGYMALVKTRQKGILKEHERRRRRLVEDFGELTFCVNDEGADVFELARSWKRQQLVATGANDYLADPQNLAYLRLARERGILLSSTLRADGRLLSVWLGFIHDAVWSGWVFAYDHDPALRKYSVGHQLLHSMIEESCRRKHRELDFSIGSEDYKWIYATHARLLGASGRPPLPERVVSLAKERAIRALAGKPAWLELARRLSGKVAPRPRIERTRSVQGDES